MTDILGWDVAENDRVTECECCDGEVLQSELIDVMDSNDIYWYVCPECYHAPWFDQWLEDITITSITSDDDPRLQEENAVYKGANNANKNADIADNVRIEGASS